jgi:hypothetical protein
LLEAIARVDDSFKGYVKCKRRDRTASRDIDREAVNDLCLWVENAPVSVITLS